MGSGNRDFVSTWRRGLMSLRRLFVAGVVAYLACSLGITARIGRAQEVLPTPSPVLDPSQAGNIDLGAGDPLDRGTRTGPGTVIDPNQVGNIDLRLQQSSRFDAGKGAEDELPIIRLSGFFQLDDGLFSQPQASQQRIGNALDGVSFRRTRL
ncbi:MAG: hypothetical protein WCQ77_15675 [Planctomycetota bacterium]